jgi:anti-sigma regulatory factor (Ser/Thr protein kinase)
VGSGEVSVRLDVDMQNVGIARRFVRSSFNGVVPSDVTSDLVLATSELVTNAFEHGRASSVLVTVFSDAARASVTVQSESPPGAIGSVDSWTIAPADQVSGRGLGIVHRIADAIDVVRSDGQVAITVHRDLAGT